MVRAIDADEAEWFLLLSANEGECVGLYEAIWELNGRFPNNSLGEKYTAAELAVRSLHAKGHIEFNRMVFTEDYRNHHCEPIDPGGLDELLSNPVSWYPDYVRVRIVFCTTEAGERAYYGGPRANS